VIIAFVFLFFMSYCDYIVALKMTLFKTFAELCYTIMLYIVILNLIRSVSNIYIYIYIN